MRRPMAKSVREKISKAKRGKPLSPQARRKISEGRRAYLARQRNEAPVERQENLLADVKEALREFLAIWKSV